MPDTWTVIAQLLEALDLAAYHEPLLKLLVEGQNIPSDIMWDDLPCGEISVKIGPHTLCTMQVIRTGTEQIEIDPIVSPTQPWGGQDEDPEFDQLQETDWESSPAAARRNI